MARDEGGSAGTVLLAFILGAVGGAALALLYAPTTGRQTRRYLGEKAREGRGLATDAVEKSREVFNERRETVAQAIERGRDAYQKARAQENA